MTLAIMGRDPETGEIGIALASTDVTMTDGLFVRAAVGAVLVLGDAPPGLGQALLDDMASGPSGPEALAQRTVLTSSRDRLQMAVMDADGRGAFFNGVALSAPAAGAVWVDCVGVGHALANETVAAAMCAGFEGTEGPLAGRLIAALDAGLESGGVNAPLVAARVWVAGRDGGPEQDAQVNEAEDPVLDLARIWGARFGGA